jgi:hypothetical protein
MTKKNPSDDEEIRVLATAFRKALEKGDHKAWGDTWKEFPRGVCGNASEILGRFLRERMGDKPTYVCGVRCLDDTPEASHGWLEINGLIVDITADQFGGPPVVVTRDHSRYTRWQDQKSSPLCRDDSWWDMYCARAYEETVAAIKECDQTARVIVDGGGQPIQETAPAAPPHVPKHVPR